MPSPSPRTLFAVMLAAVLGAYALNASLTFDGVVDDAWISARYARNLALGHGLTYNIGEAPVEGYTNLAFVLLLAAGVRAGLDVHAVMVWVGVLSGAAGLIALTHLTRHLAGRDGVPSDSAWTIAPAALFALDAHYGVVASNGIESSLFLACLVGACALVLGSTGWRRWLAGALCALLLAVRPEGLAAAGALAAWDVWRRRDRLANANAWAVAVPVALAAAAVWGGRLLYFHAWVPNTFSAKAHRGLADQVRFNLRFLWPDRAFWGPLALLFAASPWPWRTLTPARVVVTLIAAVLAAVAFTVDMWMPGGRLLLPSAALMAALIGARVVALATAPAPAWRSWAIGAMTAVAALGLAVGPLPARVRAYDRDNTALNANPAAGAAAWLGAHVPPGAHLATRDAGVLAYFAGDQIIFDELHPRALTRRHVDGADLDVAATVPANPEVFIASIQGPTDPASYYGTDALMLRRMTAPYDYLGRVEQHPGRYYDIYVRADLHVAALPSPLVTNFAGPAASQTHASRDLAHSAQ